MCIGYKVMLDVLENVPIKWKFHAAIWIVAFDFDLQLNLWIIEIKSLCIQVHIVLSIVYNLCNCMLIDSNLCELLLQITFLRPAQQLYRSLILSTYINIVLIWQTFNNCESPRNWKCNIFWIIIQVKFHLPH